MIIRIGRIFDLIIFLIMAIATYIYIYRAGKGQKLPSIRTLPAVEAVEEGIGRAIEMGGMVHFAPGGSGGRLSTQYLGMVLASLNFLGYVAKLSARNEVKFVVSCPAYSQESLPILEGIVRDAYASEGKLEDFTRDMIRFYGSDTGAYAQGISGVLVRENCKCNFLVGAWHTDCLIVLAAAHDIGAMNIGGTGRWVMNYAFAIYGDYILIGEELYAAGALLSGNPEMISGLAAEDIGKYISLAVAIIGTLVAAIALPTVLFILGV